MKAERQKKAEAKAAARTPRERSKLNVPSILLEGDAPSSPPPAQGPGERYAVRPAAGSARPMGAGQELPQAYGTGRLLLAARDPHWLYAHWDLTRDQLNSY